MPALSKPSSLSTLTALLLTATLVPKPLAAEPLAISAATFALPTDRYPHNVLGDLRGFGALDVTLADGATLRVTLPDQRVFEDIAPRLWDVDGDGRLDVVAVESDQRLGARLTAWSTGQTPDGTPTITLRAAGAFIGTRFRWLAPVGIADFTGDGRPEIAYVAMPHLAKQLVVVALKGEEFTPIARLDGISNHRIGQNFITGALFDCPAGPVMLLPSGDWKRVMRVDFVAGSLRATDLGTAPSAVAFARPSDCDS